MGLKTPEQEIEEFISAQELWLQKFLRGDFQSFGQEADQEYLKAYKEGYVKADGAIRSLQEIIRRIPKKRRSSLRGRIWSWILENTPPLGRGRPRKDDLAEEARKLKGEGKSYSQIGHKLGMTSDAARHLIKYRKKLPPEKNL